MNNCDSCNGKIKTLKRQTYQFIESGLDNVYLENITIEKCQNCDVVSPLLPKLGKLLETLACAVLLQPFPLCGADIKLLRKHLGLKAKEWAVLLRVDVSTLSRWENGEQQIGSQSDAWIRALFVLMFEEKNQKLFPQPVAARFAAVANERTGQPIIVINMNNIDVYAYRSLAA